MDRKFKLGDYVEIVDTKTKGARHLIGERFNIKAFNVTLDGTYCVDTPFKCTLANVERDTAWISVYHIKLVKDEGFEEFMNKIELEDFPTALFKAENDVEEVGYNVVPKR